MELIKNEVYVLDGWVFSEEVLEANNAKFRYVETVMEDSTPLAKFQGIVDGIPQWVSIETLNEDEDVSVVPAL